MPSSLPSDASTTTSAVWRPFGVPKRILSAALLVLLTASSALAVELGATADEQAAPTLGELVTAAAGDITPLPPMPPGARPFAVAGAPSFDGRLPALATPEPPPEPAAPAPQPAAPAGSIWDRLAECESHGEWDYGPHSGWGSGIFEGGLQFHPDTWDAFAPGVLGGAAPEAAYQASRTQQIAVAEAVLAAQGWEAWPACARKLGLIG